MSTLSITITNVGLERFTAAQLGDEIDLAIAEVGLTDSAFAVAPTLDKLPGEFRRIAAVSGEQVGDNIVHMTMRDDAEIGFTARGFGLFLADGTLFAVYGQPELLFEKSPRATFLAAIDIAFPAGDVSELTFGNTDFINPPATSARKGVVRLATQAEADAGTSTETAITPALLRRVLPIGTITLWYGSAATVPIGWAICNGQAIDRSDAAGKVTTPDLRDRVPVGAGGARDAGAAFGATEKAVDTEQGGAHVHSVQVTGSTDQAVTGVAASTTFKNDTAGEGSGKTVTGVTLTDDGHVHHATLNGSTAAADPATHSHHVTVDVTQPSLALFFIMKV